MTDILIIAFHTGLIFAMARRMQPKERKLRGVFWPALLFRLVAGIGLGLLYTWYYTAGDTFLYFEDAKTLSSLAKRDPLAYAGVLLSGDSPPGMALTLLEPRAFLLSRIASVFSLVTLDRYYLVNLYFSFMSFAGSWYFVRTLVRAIPGVTTAAILAFLLFPSAVFWSSGLIKESLALPAMFVVSATVLRLWCGMRLSPGEILGVIPALVLFWMLKYYFAAVFVAVAVTALLCRFVVQRWWKPGAVMEAITWVALLSLPLVSVSLLHPNFHPSRFLQVITANNAAYRELSAPGDFAEFENLKPEAGSVLMHSPAALFAGLFRPLPWEAGNTLQMLLAIENTVLLLLSAGALFGLGGYRSSAHRVLVLSLAVYVVLVCVFTTLSAPNFGTLSRYRSGFLPFFVFLATCNNPLVVSLERSIRRLVSQ